MPVSNQRVMMQALRTMIRDEKLEPVERLKAIGLLAELDAKKPKRASRVKKGPGVVAEVPTRASELARQLV